MARQKRKPKRQAIELSELVDVARLYFVKKENQSQIADRYNATQSAVAHWLARAQALGIVSIDVDEEFALTGTENPQLSRDLSNDFGLLDCLVVDPGAFADDDQKSDRLHTVLANASGLANLKEWIQSGDHIAVGGGRAPTKVAQFIRRNPSRRRDIRITPLSGRIWIGSWQEDGPENLQRPLDADDAARLLALAYEHERGTRFSQIGHPLYGDPETVKEIVRTECVFNDDGTWKTDAFHPPVRALVGVGVLDPESGHRLSEFLKRPRPSIAPTHLEKTAKEVSRAIEYARDHNLEYFGDVANRLFTALPLPEDLTNRTLPPERHYDTLRRMLNDLNARAIVMQWEHLRAIQHVWAIAGGAAKVKVVWTLLLNRHLESDCTRSVIKELTVDMTTALALRKAFDDFRNAPAKTREWYTRVCAQVFAD